VGRELAAEARPASLLPTDRLHDPTGLTFPLRRLQALLYRAGYMGCTAMVGLRASGESAWSPFAVCESPGRSTWGTASGPNGRRPREPHLIRVGWYSRLVPTNAAEATRGKRAQVARRHRWRCASKRAFGCHARFPAPVASTPAAKRSKPRTTMRRRMPSHRYESKTALAAWPAYTLSTGVAGIEATWYARPGSRQQKSHGLRGLGQPATAHALGSPAS
jgi:hypothetical protein